MSFARVFRAVLLSVPVTLAVAVLVVGTAAQPPKTGRKVAILVGVQDYTGTGLSNLKYCENDVTELAKVLKAQGYADGDVTLLTSAAAFDRKKENLFPTAENVRAWLKGVVEDLRPEDTVLIAFSGHGVHLKDLKDKGLHFCPKGAKLDDPKTLVSLAEVYDELEKHCKAGVKLLVVDACRNDPTDGRSGGDGRLESKTRPLVPDPPGGTVAFFSCSTGQMAYESDALKHGIFFHHLIQGLKGGPADAPIARDGEVTVPLLEDYLTRVVPVAVKKDRGDPLLKQTPERRGSLRGAVVLAKVSVQAKEPKAGEEREFEIAAGVKMVFCYIPPGKATLGSPKEEMRRSSDETEHEYMSRGFWLGKYEVTQGEWTAVMGDNPSYFDGKKDNKAKGLDTSRFPVERVSWDDCQKFFGKVNKRPGVAKAFGRAGKFALPHEDEWEYAYRGGKGNGRAYYWGDGLNGTEANCDGNYPFGVVGKGPSLERTCAVEFTDGGKYEAHPWGLRHMAGNVYEWCENEYSKDPRVLRGGSWYSLARYCCAAHRYLSSPAFRDDRIGFRVCFRLD